jgi:hypothetical protein
MTISAVNFSHVDVFLIPKDFLYIEYIPNCYNLEQPIVFDENSFNNYNGNCSSSNRNY